MSKNGAKKPAMKAKAGCVKMAAGGAAKARQGGFPGVKKAPLPTPKKK